MYCLKKRYKQMDSKHTKLQEGDLDKAIKLFEQEAAVHYNWLS